MIECVSVEDELRYYLTKTLKVSYAIHKYKFMFKLEIHIGYTPAKVLEEVSEVLRNPISCTLLKKNELGNMVECDVDPDMAIKQVLAMYKVDILDELYTYGYGKAPMYMMQGDCPVVYKTPVDDRISPCRGHDLINEEDNGGI